MILLKSHQTITEDEFSVHMDEGKVKRLRGRIKIDKEISAP